MLRAVIVGVIFFFIIIDAKIKSEFSKAIRIFSPLLYLSFFYSETDALNNLIYKTNLDPFFSEIEHFLFNTQPSIVFSKLMPYNFFAELMYFGYFSYYLLIVVIPLYLYLLKNKETAIRVIYIIVTSFLFYYLFFIIFPVAGPQFYFKNSLNDLPKAYIFGDIMRTIQYYGEGQTAAFPSSHVSICLILLYISFRHAKKLFYVVLTISILLVLSTVYIKAHYAIDVIAAFVFTPILYLLINKIYKEPMSQTN